MDEALTPNPKQRPISTATTRIQAPTSPFFLGSNDDRLEREQARAARVAASRRKSIIFARGPQPEKESDPCFDKQQILELFQNCIKLASENVSNCLLHLELGHKILIETYARNSKSLVSIVSVQTCVLLRFLGM